MPSLQLIADSGATKTSWCVTGGEELFEFHTQGINPYFFTGDQVTELLKKEWPSELYNLPIREVHFYGAGCGEEINCRMVMNSIRQALPSCGKITVETDVLGAAKALCGHTPGVVGILGTGSNSCVFDGSGITRNNPSPGFILGDEGSGAMLGKKVIQYFIYKTFDEELLHNFTKKYRITYAEILDQVYKKPMPNRFLASFAPFLSENRGHYMIENIIEDGLSEFFFTHLYKYAETWTHPIHFSGSIASAFSDVLHELCHSFELQLGRVLKGPMEGLIAYHSE
jgi:N-acetylglucosamine kinase-like BadF-type ATPase